jgi:hypothetical protein
VRCDYTVGTVATDLGDVMVLQTLPTDVRYREATGLLGCSAESTRLPSRPGEFHPEPLTDPDLILSHHPARAID